MNPSPINIIYKCYIQLLRGVITLSEDEKYAEIMQRLKRLMEKQRDVEIRMKQIEERVKVE
jgi:hypothetical protein